jgi:hypothetical protein
VQRCYICGREASRRVIAEPHMLPVCRDRDCGHIAAHLPALHCSARRTDGGLCGAPAVPQFEADGQRLCADHLRALWAHNIQAA